MCGIAGCYQQADGHKLVDIMTERIAHRGPDSAGVWSHEDERSSVHLGHRRLSIIDLRTAADQPLTKDGLTIIYNGELYNYRELRAELASPRRPLPHQLGHRGRARGLAALGAAAPASASAACSRSRCSTSAPASSSWLATRSASSRCTTCPAGTERVFASELKALTAAVGSELRIEPGRPGRVDARTYWVPEQRCAIDGVRKLPGRFLGAAPPGRHDCTVQQYWQHRGRGRRRPPRDRPRTWAR